jgi:hypothetical protein
MLPFSFSCIHMQCFSTVQADPAGCWLCISIPPHIFRKHGVSSNFSSINNDMFLNISSISNGWFTAYCSLTSFLIECEVGSWSDLNIRLSSYCYTESYLCTPNQISLILLCKSHQPEFTLQLLIFQMATPCFCLLAPSHGQCIRNKH